jgi:hypothetical protein
MHKFSKQKTTFFAAVLIILFLIMPHEASALTFWDILTGGANFIVNGIAMVFLYMFFGGPLLIIAIFSTLSNIFLQAVISFSITGTSYTNSPAVQIGWPIVRSLANMFAVLGFVIIGIAFTLRLESYGSKKVLINLIIATVLINFSLLICGVFIDASNIMMKFFFSKTGAMSNLLPAVSDLVTLVFKTSWASNPLDFITKTMGMILFYFIVFFVNILYAVLILARVVMLWMLVILSPLAFVSYVFPFTKNIFQMWWKNFFQWCIIVLPAGLFYYIASKLVSDSLSKPTNVLSDVLSGATDWMDFLLKFVSNSLSTILVPSLFLIAGFIVSLQFSTAGASAIMGFANKYKGAAFKGGLGVLGKSANTMGKIANWASEKTGGTKTRVGRMFDKASVTFNKQQDKSIAFQGWVSKRKSEFSRGLETAGAIPEGTTRRREAAAFKEKAENAAYEYNRAKATGDTKTMEREKEKARKAASSQGGVESAASLKAILDAGDIHDTFRDKITGKVNLDQANAALLHAASQGADNIRKEAVKTFPELERTHQPTLEKIKKQHPGWSDDRVEHEAVVRAAKKIEPEKLDRDFIDTNNYQVIADAGDRMNKKQKEALKLNLIDIKEEMDAIKASKGIKDPKWKELANKYWVIDKIKT